MKIICIGRNYADHAKELNNPVPNQPIYFLKPDSAVLPKKNPFFIPAFSNAIHHEIEVVLRIHRLGKSIQAKFAHKYYNQISVGIDFTARDIQARCKEKGHPWEIAKAFDGSAVLGEFLPKEEVGDLNDLNFHLTVNGETRQQGNTRDMLFHFDRLIEYVSQFMTLKIGDLIFTGTPVGVGPVKPGDVLEGFLEEKQLFTVKVK